MALGYFMSIVTGLGLPSFVFLFGDIINSFSGANILDAIRPTCIQFTIIGSAIWVTSYFYYALLVIMSENIGQKTRVAYLKGILQQDIAWFDSINVTELSSRLSKECQAIQKALGEKMGTIQLSMAMCFSGLFFAFFRGWWFSLILLFVFPIIFLMTFMITLAMQSGFMQNLRSYGQSAGYAEQALNAIKVVQAFGMEQTEMINYDKYLGRARATGVKTHMKRALAIAGFFFAMFGYYAYAFYVGSWLVTKQVNNSITDKPYNAGDIMSCFFGIVFGVFSLGMATPNIKAVTEGRVAGKMAYDIIERIPAIQLDQQGAKPVGDIKGEIEFRNVTFTYPTRPEQKVLDNFSAVFREGKTTAIVGASGSGKSTIIQMIERFYDPDQGEIYLDGKPLNSLHLRELRRKIGYVGQEPVLFNNSIKENLLYGKPDATDEEVIQALKSANAYDFINEKMGKTGINTHVGNAGGQLSGGQKQRIAIARAFIKKPKILLLDEATSALDKRNEKEVQGAIDRIRVELGGSITTVVIAHRLSTIRNSDNIIVMQKGKIIEQGDHNTLLQQYPEGTYAKFVKEQENSEDQQQQQHNDHNPAIVNMTEEYDNNLDTQDAPQQQTTQNYEEPLSPSENPKNQKQNQQQKSKQTDNIEQQETQMKQKQDQLDSVEDQQLADFKKQQAKNNNFIRLAKISEPKINIFIGIVVSAGQGLVMPWFGILLSKMLFVLNGWYGADTDTIREKSDYYCLLMFIAALVALCTGFSQKFCFGVIGENVTLKIRKSLYRSILMKHIGFFDEKENSPGVISSSMASDCQIINGVSAEGLASQLEAMFAVLAGIVIGFIYNWKISLVCLACPPFMIIGGVMNAKFQAGLSNDSDSASKEASLLAGDAILNYRTVASFGYEDQLIRDYSKLLDGPRKIAQKRAHVIGVIFGFSQFVQYAVFAALYYFGALFIQHDIDNMNFKDQPDDIFVAIFAMMFGAMAAGQAQQFGPDMGKAKAASAKVFGMMDLPSKINAVEQDQHQSNLIDLDYNNFKGQIEFRDVWFRYPTRKNDWILKGLNMKINAKETVALVGESGCGKSTIVSLLLRFYDVDQGQILIDGVNIKQYNLHQLRHAMGLVMQEPTLFNYTVLENILYGQDYSTNSQVREAAQIANALEFIESQQLNQAFDDSAESLIQRYQENEQYLVSKLGKQEYDEVKQLLQDLQKDEIKKGKFMAQAGDIDRREDNKKDIELHNGFNVDCGLKGSKLSGGQKQRIAIARAIIRKPKMLILDEATSALDEASQRKVQVALENIMNDRTSIVIAHRLSTVEKCDRIMVLESGRLVEEGGFQELKQKDGGIFAQLASGMQNPKNK
uniref:Putative ABC transporter n=3 Tax=Oxytricha trifallax TaxID=94289 RepID=Q9BJF3_OXYTR|nr:putative ABC transporter [Sterkiella histriomuscorum]